MLEDVTAILRGLEITDNDVPRRSDHIDITNVVKLAAHICDLPFDTMNIKNYALISPYGGVMVYSAGRHARVVALEYAEMAGWCSVDVLKRRDR